MRRLFRPAPPTSDGLDIGALAPMVDMMTLLLVFLLRSYSTEAAPSPPSGPFELAGTASEDTRQPAVEILISPEAIYLQGRRVVATAYLGDDPLVHELYDPLLLLRGKHRVEVHADRTVPYAVLKRVFYTAKAAGYDELVLVAANRSSL
jgi:biopolymer transport protein ExbD